jgi:hypothetical protein
MIANKCINIQSKVVLAYFDQIVIGRLTTMCADTVISGKITRCFLIILGWLVTTTWSKIILKCSASELVLQLVKYMYIMHRNVDVQQTNQLEIEIWVWNVLLPLIGNKCRSPTLIFDRMEYIFQKNSSTFISKHDVFLLKMNCVKLKLCSCALNHISFADSGVWILPFFGEAKTICR